MFVCGLKPDLVEYFRITLPLNEQKNCMIPYWYTHSLVLDALSLGAFFLSFSLCAPLHITLKFVVMEWRDLLLLLLLLMLIFVLCLGPLQSQTQTIDENNRCVVTHKVYKHSLLLFYNFNPNSYFHYIEWCFFFSLFENFFVVRLLLFGKNRDQFDDTNKQSLISYATKLKLSAVNNKETVSISILICYWYILNWSRISISCVRLGVCVMPNDDEFHFSMN